MPTALSAMNRRRSSKLPFKPSSSTSLQPNRLFTEADEIDLLNSLLNTTRNPFSGGYFSKTQITDKIRRLKQKYHKQARSKSSIKTAHDHETFEIARNIWGPKKTRITSATPFNDEKKEHFKGRSESSQIWGPEKTRICSPTPLNNENKEHSKGRSESTINWREFPFLMRQVSRAFPRSDEVYKQGLTGLGEDILKALNEKWMQLEMEEAGIEARRAQLLIS